MPARVRVLVVATTVALTGACLAEPPPEGPSRTQDGFSLLNEAGIARIKRTGNARFDLRDLRLTREEVGIEPGRLGPQVGSPRQPELDLELVGPRGTERATTSTFMASFFSGSDVMDTFTWFESYDTRAEGDAALARAVEHWGLPRGTVTNWQDTVAYATAGPFADPDSTTRSSYGPGLSASGLVAEVTVRTRPVREGETLQLSVYLEPKYYTGESLAELRRLRR